MIGFVRKKKIEQEQRRVKLLFVSSNGVTLDSFSYDFAIKLKSEFEINMIGEINFFLGHVIKTKLRSNFYFTI